MKIVKLTGQQIFEYNAAAPQMKVAGAPFKLLHALSRNATILHRETQVLSRASKPPKAIVQHHEERLDINKRFAQKDEIGSPLIVNNDYVIDEANKEARFTALKDLFDRNRDILNEEEKRVRDWNVAITEDLIEVEFYTVPASILPDNFQPDIGVNEMIILSFAIDDDVVEA